jgi:hypothetical protein
MPTISIRRHPPMTDYNEELLTAAKLYEQVQGRIDGDDRLLAHTGLISDPGHRSNLSFVENAVHRADDLDATAFGDTGLGCTVYSDLVTDEATEAVHRGNDLVLSHLVGLTEQDLDGSTLRLVARLQEELHNNDAPAFILGADNPNTGKTNTMSLLAELRAAEFEDYLILSNVRSWSLTDRVVTSAHDLAVALLEERDRPKTVIRKRNGSRHWRTGNRRNASRSSSSDGPPTLIIPLMVCLVVPSRIWRVLALRTIPMTRRPGVGTSTLIRFSLIVYRFDRAQPRGRYRNVSY